MTLLVWVCWTSKSLQKSSVILVSEISLTPTFRYISIIRDIWIIKDIVTWFRSYYRHADICMRDRQISKNTHIDLNQCLFVDFDYPDTLSSSLITNPNNPNNPDKTLMETADTNHDGKICLEDFRSSDNCGCCVIDAVVAVVLLQERIQKSFLDYL